MKGEFYDKIFNLENFIKLGYMDFQPAGFQKQEVSSIRSGRVDVIYYDSLNFSDLLNEDIINWINHYSYGKIDTEPVIFTIPKNGDVRRTLKFPNLYSYLSLAVFLLREDNKNRIITALQNDYNSTSKFFGWKPFSFDKTKRIQDGLLFGHLKFFKTDFTSFYHTMYTHSIAWITMGKEQSKLHKSKKIFGNHLDSLVGQEQDGETHGLPTGNLLTKIIAEYYMACFDQELREKLPKDVTFHRYVDDFIFAYNSDSSKERTIKELRRLVNRYALSLNENKTRAIKYYDLVNENHLIHYFDDLDISRYSVKRLVVLINNFLKLGLEDQKNGVKGSDKLVFTGIRFWFKSIKDINLKKKVLFALVFSDDRYKEASIIENLMQRVLLDSRLTIYYLQLIDELLIFSKVHKNYALENHLHTLCLRFRIRAQEMLKQALALEMHQSVYSIMLMFNKANVHLSDGFILSFLNKAIDSESNPDDFSLLLLLKEILCKKRKNLFLIVGRLDAFLHKYTSISTDPFVQQHWLIRYELLYQYDNNLEYREMVLLYYRRNNAVNGKRVLDLKNIRKYYLTNRGRMRHKEALSFYDYLLKKRVRFSKL